MNKEKIAAFLQKSGKSNWLWIVGLLGILLIGFSSLFGGSDDVKETATQTESVTDTQEYAKMLETRLEEMLSHIQQAGTCKVMVTMEQGTEYVYATEEKTSIDTSETSEDSRFSTGSRSAGEEKYIMVSTKEGDRPLLLTELAPRVKGVVVICSGGGNPTVAQTIQKALATALDISGNRICVVEGTIS